LPVSKRLLCYSLINLFYQGVASFQAYQ
jgi:hypothetical protein